MKREVRKKEKRRKRGMVGYNRRARGRENT